MRVVLIAAALAAASGTAAHAAIPAFAVTCGKKNEVKANAGGPIMVNGKPAKVTVEKDNFIEATKGKLTFAITIGADGAVAVTFKTKKEDKGACTTKPPAAAPAETPATPPAETAKPPA